MPHRRSTSYNQSVWRYLTSKAARLALFALPALACDGSLRMVVVEQSDDRSLSLGGKIETGGKPSVAATGGSVEEGGSPEPAQGGSAGTADGGTGVVAVGGMPDAPLWDAPARYTASFVPFGFPEQHVRHLDAVGAVAFVDMGSPVDKEAASFEMIPGLYAAKCVSFRAVDKIGTFFRHAGSRIQLHAVEDQPLFLADATFCQEPGMADPQAITFRAVNYPQRVIHLRNVSELWIDDVPDPMTPEFAAAATFYRTTALIENPVPSP